jgi:uracil-DNA glycosylase family 4
MSVRVPGEGPLPCRVMIVGERPGYEEVRRRPRPFIGPSGIELFARIRDVVGLERREVFTTNLVKTFSPDPPSVEEVERDRPELMRELLMCRPQIVVTVGYHAARAFLPQFTGVSGDLFHGIPFPMMYGRLKIRHAIVLPVIHSAAALRQPSRYQQQLTDDLMALKGVLEGTLRPFAPSTPLVEAVPIDQLQGDVLAIDTEGSIHRPWTPECISLCADNPHAALVEAPAFDGVQQAIDRAETVTVHHLKHDLKALAAAGITIPERKWSDTMVMSYILNLPQALKTLMWRELGWPMKEYDDLIRPLDDARVTQTLERWEARQVIALRDAELNLRLVKMRVKHARTRAKKRGLPFTLGERGGLSPMDIEKWALIVKALKGRCRTSVTKILRTTTAESKRARWLGSRYAEHITLPPVPTWKDLPDEVRGHYARLDAVAHRTLRDTLWQRIEREGLERAYYVDMGVLPMVIRSEQIGMACNPFQLNLLAKQFRKDFLETCTAINELAGKVVNPLSGEQVSECLFQELGITPTKLTPSRKHHQTGDKYLKARRGEHDIIQLILNARQLSKYASTYAEKIPRLLQSVDDDPLFRTLLQADEEEVLDQRYFPQWKTTRTATGRLAEEVILLIPKHDPLARSQGRENRATAIRNCFHATRGHTLVSVDLSQIELRVMAHVSDDPVMLESYRKGEDLHARTAHELLGAPASRADQDDSAHRLPAKTLNFAIINASTEYGILDQLYEAGQLHWTLEQVKALLDDWFSVFAGVKKFFGEQQRLGRERGYVESMYGRRRYLAGLHSTDERIVKEAERQCLFMIQSSADEISKAWNRRIWKRIILPARKEGWYCEPWVRIHDDTTLEVDAAHAKDVADQMVKLVPQLLSIPVTAEAKMGTRWGDLH